MVFVGGSGLNAARGTNPISMLTPRSRSGRPVKRPPHIVGSQSARGANASSTQSWFMDTTKSDKGQSFTGIVAAPPLPPVDKDEVSDEVTPAKTNAIGHKYAAAMGNDTEEDAVSGCIGGRIHRPDTCYLTHTYVKQEITYLSRRVDEIARYFLGLEQMIGTGVLGPLLEKSSRELEAKLEVAETLEDTEEIRGLIDAAIRLGYGPHRYAVLRERLQWLEVGKQREDVRRRLAELKLGNENTLRRRISGSASIPAAMRAGGPAAFAEELHGLIDEATSIGVYPSEIAIARHRLQETEQLQIDEQMISAATEGDIGAVESALRHGANINTCRMEDGATLWHIAAELPSTQGLALTRLAGRDGANGQLYNSAGHTPLMLAASRQEENLVKELLELGVDPDMRNVSVEQVAECSDAEVLAAAMANVNGKTRRLMNRLDVGGLCLDPGDELICGDDLQLPVFRRAAMRSALHLAVIRAGGDGAEVLVLEALIQKNADINAIDELGCTPLWYAARAGRAGSVSTLLGYGACLMNTSGISVLMAAHHCHAHASTAGNVVEAAGSAAVARQLIREGACDAAYESFNPGFMEGCRIEADAENAVAMSGGTFDIMEMLQEQSRACQLRYADRLLLQTDQRLCSAREATEFAAAAHPEFQQLLFKLARQTGGRARVCRKPTASRLMRMARQAGECHPGASGDPSVDEAAIGWGRIIAAVHGTLVYHDVETLRQAMCDIEDSCGFHIRSFSDQLVSASQRYPKSRCVTFMVEVHCAICALHLTVERLDELEEGYLAEGNWLRTELSSAIMRGSMGEVRETLDHAEENIGKLRLATVLRMPLNTDHGSPEWGGGGLCKDTPVCAAVRVRHIGIIDLLLDSQASPNSLSADGESALTLAAKFEDLRCLALLLTSGADPSTLDMDQLPPNEFKAEASRLVMQVITQRHLDAKALAALVENFDDRPESLHQAFCLLKAGADANTKIMGDGPCGETMSVLSCATKLGNRRLVRLLLDFKAQVRSTGKSASALQLAKGTPLETMIAFQACEELQAAVNASDLTAIQELLEAGVDPESVLSDTLTHEAKTLLQYTAELPVEMAVPHLEDLLRRGASPERRDGHGRTILLTCVQAGRPVKIVETLVAFGADIAASDNHGINAAMYAAQMGSCSTLEVLLDAGESSGVDVGRMKDSSGADALTHALKFCQAPTVSMLLNRGYELNKLNAVGEVFAACRNGNVDIVQQLLAILMPFYPTIAAATGNGEEGVALTGMPTLLMEAVRLQSVETIEILVQHGAFLYPRCMSSSPDDDELCNSAWSMAGEHEGMRSALRLALPQEFLQICRSNNEVAIANLRAEEENGLVTNAADFDMVDEAGYGCLDYVVQHGSEELENWLVDHGARFQSSAVKAVVLLEPVKSGDPEGVARRLKAGADVNAVDGHEWTALDWSLMAGSMAGYVWYCVQHAMQYADGDVLEDHESSKSGQTGSSSLASSLRQGGNRLGSSGKLVSFNMGSALTVSAVEENEPKQPTVSKQDTVARATSSKMSLSNFSYRSFGTSVAPSSRSGAGHNKRKKHDPPADPRGTNATIEQLLVEAGGRLGSDVRSAKYCLWAPLHERNLQCVRRRIQAGADCTVLNGKGISLPHSALDMANPAIAKSFVEAGASPDSRDHRGRTVIWRALEAKFADLVTTCVEYGSDLKQGLGNVGSLAHLALETGQPQVAIEFLQSPNGCPADVQNQAGKSVLWRAVELRKPDVARACLAQGVDLTTIDAVTGKSVLHLALDCQPDLAVELVEAGAPTNVEDSKGRSALSLAAGLGADEVVDACLEAGAKPGLFGGPEAWQALQNCHIDLTCKLIRAAGPSRPRSTQKKRNIRQQLSVSSASPVSNTTRTTPSRKPAAGEDDRNIEYKLFEHAAGEAYRRVVVTYLEVSLRGAGIEEETSTDLADELANWVFQGETSEGRRHRATQLELLPATIFEEGTSVAAGDLQKLSLPLQLVQQVAHAEIEMSADPALASVHRRGSGSAFNATGSFRGRASTARSRHASALGPELDSSPRPARPRAASTQAMNSSSNAPRSRTSSKTSSTQVDKDEVESVKTFQMRMQTTADEMNATEGELSTTKADKDNTVASIAQNSEENLISGSLSPAGSSMDHAAESQKDGQVGSQTHAMPDLLNAEDSKQESSHACEFDDEAGLSKQESSYTCEFDNEDDPGEEQ